MLFLLACYNGLRKFDKIARKAVDAHKQPPDEQNCRECKEEGDFKHCVLYRRARPDLTGGREEIPVPRGKWSSSAATLSPDLRAGRCTHGARVALDLPGSRELPHGISGSFAHRIRAALA